VILDLDDDRCLDPATSGAKGAWLARGRRVGLPVEAGFVVTAEASRTHLALGRAALERRGSGGARLEVAALALAPAMLATARECAARLGSPLIVRSSSVLEGSGAWSGVFTTYPDVGHDDLEAAIRGCWAATFSVAALQRHEAAGITPGSVPMAVVVQAYVDAGAGGVAWVEGARVAVVGVHGSPAPLVQGWEPGVRASIDRAGRIYGGEALRVLGAPNLRRVAALVRVAADQASATSVEWGRRDDGAVVLFQLLRRATPAVETIRVPTALRSNLARRLDRLVRRFPGPMGEALVLPWAIGDPDALLDVRPEEAPTDAASALRAAESESASLAADVWGAASPEAQAMAARVLAALRTERPGRALSRIARLAPPDPDAARSVIALVARARRGVAEAGAVEAPELGWHVDPAAAASVLTGAAPASRRTRIGFDRWEPFSAAVVMGTGRRSMGVAASPGIGVGRVRAVTDAASAARVRSRDVVLASHPIALLGPLLWDAAAVVTVGGGPGAHLFESARALGIPAVSGINLDEVLGGRWEDADAGLVAVVDGDRGTVTLAPW
jgi:hypothetical protein